MDIIIPLQTVIVFIPVENVPSIPKFEPESVEKDPDTSNVGTSTVSD